MLALENIHDLNHKAILATSQNIRADTHEVTRFMIIGTVIALLISAYAGYRLSRSVLRPIQWLTRATRELGEGKLDQPVPVATRDELGELALAFNKMAAQFRNIARAPARKSSGCTAPWKPRSLRSPTPFLYWTRKGTSN